MEKFCFFCMPPGLKGWQDHVNSSSEILYEKYHSTGICSKNFWLQAQNKTIVVWPDFVSVIVLAEEWHHPILFSLMVTCECLTVPTLNIIGLHSLNREIACFLLTSIWMYHYVRGRERGFPWPSRSLELAFSACKTKHCSKGSQSCRAVALFNAGTGHD